jgi:hypothetical protein
VRLTQRNSNLPPEKRRGRGRGVVWRAYKWPSRGDVLSSGRRRNDQIIEIFYTPLVYLIVAPLAFVFRLIQIAHRTNRSHPTNKKHHPYKALRMDFLATFFQQRIRTSAIASLRANGNLSFSRLPFNKWIRTTKGTMDGLRAPRGSATDERCRPNKQHGRREQRRNDPAT